jgi:excisionase family DNA binding protein
MPGTEQKVDPSWMPEPALWTDAQAARFLNVSERTIRNLVRAGQLVRRKIGKRSLIPRSSCLAFIKRDHPTQSLH